MNLETNIQQYQPSEATIQLVRQTRIVLLVGIAGAGKDTIKKQLLATNRFYDLVSHTTRSPRQNNSVWEQDGIDYHFVDNGVITEMLERGAFIEAKLVHGTVYGTSVAELARAYDQQKIAIADIDVQGVAEYVAITHNVAPIFILPPSYDEWRRRLEARYETSEVFASEWPKRRASAIKELRHVLEVPYYHFLVNDDITRAVTAAQSIADTPNLEAEKNIAMRDHAQTLLEAIEAAY